jgi:hypothetical protein
MVSLSRAVTLGALVAGAAALRTGSVGTSSPYSTKDFFCYTVLGPTDYTIWQAQKQMQECGGFAILANYTDEAKGVVKFHDGSTEVGKMANGWTDNTDLFLEAWKFIIDSKWPDQFKWFVKIDADTVFRARYLPQVTAVLNADVPMGLRVQGRIRGAVEVLSYKVFRHKNSWMIHTRTPEDSAKDDTLGGEDAWIDYALNKAGMELPEAPLTNEGCLSLLVTYMNLPDKYKREEDGNVGGTDNIDPRILQDRQALKTDSVRKSDACSRNEVVGIHPAKDIKVYEKFVAMDKELYGR